MSESLLRTRADWKHEKSHLFTSALRPVLQFANFFRGPNFDLIMVSRDPSYAKEEYDEFTIRPFSPDDMEEVVQ